MILPTFSTAAGAVSLLLSVAVVSGETIRGLAWATNNDFAPTIGGKPKVKWYHHWQDGPVKQMPSKVEYVPMFWGHKKWDKWNNRKNDINKKWPKYLLGFNEPDISSQADMSPEYAAQIWMQEIHSYGTRGVQLGSPAIAWDLNWMDKFLKALHKNGGYINFMTLHWYGSWKDIEKFKKFVKTAHDRFGYDIWITELGVTSSSYPSKSQAKSFMMQAYSWMDSTGYVKRASWFGCFQENQPPDSYATGKNALFKKGNALSDMGFWYGYTQNPDRRRELPAGADLKARHARLAAIAAREDDDDDDVVVGDDAEDCDDICRLREGSISEWEAEVQARQLKEAEVVA